ncbi:MAG: DUF4139 domain-containing protein [Treponema sp.]|jgi:hypothetical protein|nr:DUF4139 domain-containing protein [Treponema sp.]
MKKHILLSGALLFLCGALAAEGLSENGGRQGKSLPLRRVTLFSSGVGFFEHEGDLSGTAAAPAEVPLAFEAGAVNDALKSLLVSDPVCTAPSLHYGAENSLIRTLRSLRVDLSGEPGLADILGSLRGEEIEIRAPEPLSGLIVFVEKRQGRYDAPQELTLGLLTGEGLRAVPLQSVVSFSFKNATIEAELRRGLASIAAAGSTDTRTLLLRLPGEGSRNVRLSYVIPTPVWKAAYRLDLSGETPRLQGWAIVDNDSDTDWQELTVSLVNGRPVSFVQNLYPPYRVARPVLPLAIAGTAEASVRGAALEEEEEERVFEAAADSTAYARQSAPRPLLSLKRADSAVPEAAPLETARGAAAGDQFAFTLPQKVTLERRTSAMFPLVEALVPAEKMLVLAGGRIGGAGQTTHPELCAEITNSSGMRLPAGPVTVYDGGTYAGDALLAFLSEGEKRLISWGEDAAVTASAANSSARFITAVTAAKGVMTLKRKLVYEKTYTVKNASPTSRALVIEHPITRGAALSEPAKYREKTADLYRFDAALKAAGTLTFTVKEEQPLSEQVVLARLGDEAFAAYAASAELPDKARAALEKAINLKQAAQKAAADETALEKERGRLAEEQDRVRKNLEAVGNTSPQGASYLARLAALDTDIDSLASRLVPAREAFRAAKQAYDDYLAALEW